MKLIVRSPSAHKDLRDIWVYVALDNQPAADKLVHKIEEAILLLGSMPGAGPARHELQADLRSFPVSPYVIFYRDNPDHILIYRVLHGARDLRKYFKR